MSTDTQLAPKGRLNARWLVIWGVLALIGVIVYILQQMQTFGVEAPSNLHSPISWNLYIAAFLTAAGAGSGLFILVGLADLGVIHIDATHRLHAAILGLIALVASGIYVLLDLGKPLNMLNLLVGLKTSSLLFWDFLALLVMVIVGAVYLALLIRRSEVQKPLSWMVIITGFLVLIVESWLLASYTARPFWSGGDMPLRFIAQGLLTGVALVILLGAGREGGLRNWAAGLVIFSLFLELSTLLTGWISSEPREISEIGLLLVDPFFIAGVLFLILGWILLYNPSPVSSVIGAALLVFAVLAQKLAHLVAGQAVSVLPITSSGYTLNFPEGIIVLGVAALGALAFVAFRPGLTAASGKSG